jgi:hypothetical protein
MGYSKGPAPSTTGRFVRHRWIGLALGLLLLVPHLARAYEDLGLRLILDDPVRGFESLSMDERLSRIDVLEHQLENASLPDSSLLKLSRLYAGSPLVKHRVKSFEYDEKLVDPDAFDALRDRAHRRWRVWNQPEAEELFGQLTALYPDSATAWRDRGVFLLDLGLRTLDQALLTEALESFRAAVECPDATYDDQVGLASTLLATNERYELTEVGERLMEDPRGAISGRLYAALGYRAKDQEYSAEALFRDAIARMEPRTAERFRDLEGFLEQFQPLLLTEGALEPLAPKRLLGWWERLTECDVLFGQPLDRVNGWNTEVGRVYLKFGRPLRHHYFPPFGSRTPQEVDAFSRPPDYRNDLILSLQEASVADGLWVWILRVGDAEVPYVFRADAQYADWGTTEHSHLKFAEPLKKALPLALAAPVPVAHRPETQLHLSARHATFVSSADRVRAESFLSVRAVNLDEDADLTASISILDEKGHEVERRSSPLESAEERADMLTRIPGTSGTVSGGIAGFGASLPPGRYVFRLEVEDSDHDLYAATDQAFWLRARRGGFGTSDLLLADSFADYHAQMQLPAQFVKYARAVVPHPEYRVHPGQQQVYVYYEVYGAQIDESGNAHLDTLYEIFASEDFDPLDAGRPEGQGTRPIERVQFPTERIGRSAEKVVVKGTVVDLSKLQAGDYVLAVRVTDRLARRETQSFVSFGL